MLDEDRVDQIRRDWHRERPEIDTSPQAVIGRLSLVALAIGRRLDVVYAAHGLSEGEFDLLAALRRAGAPFERLAGDLAIHTMVTTGGLTKRIDRLARRGLVERVSPVDDGRRRLVRLTPRGRSLIDDAFTDHMRNEARLLAELGTEDAAALEPILSRWLKLIEGELNSGDSAAAQPSL